MRLSRNQLERILENDQLLEEFKSQMKNDETCELLCEVGYLKGMFHYPAPWAHRTACPTIKIDVKLTKVNKNSLSRSDFFAMIIRGKEDMKNDLKIDCTNFPVQTVRKYVETILGISERPISLEILLDLIRFLLDLGKAEKGKNY